MRRAQGGRAGRRLHRPSRSRRRGRHAPRSCSRSSASPTPAPASRPASGAWTRSLTKHLLRAAGIPTPDWVAFNSTAFRELGAADALEEIEARLGFPLVVKPAAQGSALGVRFAASREDVPEALVAAFSYDDRVLLERHVEGRELAVSLLDGEPLPVVEVRPKEEDRFNYEARYEIGRTDYVCPADLSADEAAEVQEVARAHLGGAGLRGLRPRRPDARRQSQPAGARGERDPRPHRHQPVSDGRRGRRARGSRSWSGRIIDLALARRRLRHRTSLALVPLPRPSLPSATLPPRPRGPAARTSDCHVSNASAWPIAAPDAGARRPALRSALEERGARLDPGRRAGPARGRPSPGPVARRGLSARACSAVRPYQA